MLSHLTAQNPKFRFLLPNRSIVCVNIHYNRLLRSNVVKLHRRHAGSNINQNINVNNSN